jgi:hypothetical protein
MPATEILPNDISADLHWAPLFKLMHKRAYRLIEQLELGLHPTIELDGDNGLPSLLVGQYTIQVGMVHGKSRKGASPKRKYAGLELTKPRLLSVGTSSITEGTVDLAGHLVDEAVFACARDRWAKTGPPLSSARVLHLLSSGVDNSDL